MTTDAMVMVEARRIAKGWVKDEMRKNGLAISLVEQVEISRAATMLLQVCREELIAEAKAKLFPTT